MTLSDLSLSCTRWSLILLLGLLFALGLEGAGTVVRGLLEAVSVKIGQLFEVGGRQITGEDPASFFLNIHRVIL